MESTQAPPSSICSQQLFPINPVSISDEQQHENAEIADDVEEEEVKGGEKDGSPQTSHKNAFIRTSDNTPEEKDNIASKFEETVLSFMDIKENLSENDSSSSCSPCSCDSYGLEDQEMRETVKDTNFHSGAIQSTGLSEANFGSFTS